MIAASNKTKPPGQEGTGRFFEMEKFTEEIQGLIDQREKARNDGRFKEADVLRKQLSDLGFEIFDQKGKPSLCRQKKENTMPKESFLILFGSGEISPTAVKIHDYAFKDFGKDKIKIVLISTPAGFQPNVKTVYEEIADFFTEHLKNYHPEISIIYANTLEDANNPNILTPLETADYVFTGPGSPTYAVKNLRNSLLYKRIIEKVESGATLSLASAATVAFSRFALPVYEIYKVGSPLYWESGLDFYTKFFKPLTIIPHFNNNEGGKKTDTSRCFAGKERFEKLKLLLPPTEKIWGIDEHTALIINLKTKETLVMGKGKLHSVQ